MEIKGETYSRLVIDLRVDTDDKGSRTRDLSVKEELRLAILERRKAEGKEDIRLSIDSVSENSSKNELTDEEIQRQEDRRRKNRLAAKKCRMKKKNLMDDLNKIYKELKGRRRELLSRIAEIEREKADLRKRVLAHSAGQDQHSSANVNASRTQCYLIPNISLVWDSNSVTCIKADQEDNEPITFHTKIKTEVICQ
ncbi:hypothetical protein CHS0354_014599 [Potamilus streckersoni]|uniref:BZIP domain-containing protein n=1 Tax=Potamilus streckersoni TaxID=2493646 RepID=A0AAE0VGI6_9BIVA|nr:hypothetical protein CHS0354_014599 [Potamilus streckersoni]